MMRYLADPAKDMHRDSAQQCFMLSDAEYRTCLPRPKEVRNVAKGDFVFAGFYGSYWYKMAPKLWKKMRQLKLQTGDGKYRVEGEGFLWRQSDSFLTISNHVRTVIEVSPEKKI